MTAWTSLWDFALWAYDRPGVKAALLALQDDEGDDVVTLLALMGAACFRAPLTATDLSRLSDAVLPWQRAVTASLRAARRAAATDGERALERDIRSAEIAAERVALGRAEAALAPFRAAAPADAARAAFVSNFDRYRLHERRPVTAATRAHLTVLVQTEVFARVGAGAPFRPAPDT